MARKVLKKINTKLNFLWRQNNYLYIPLEDCYVMLLHNRYHTKKKKECYQVYLTYSISEQFTV